MRILTGLVVTLAWLVPVAAGGPARAATIDLVAAENFYGDMAAQIAGDRVHVTSVISNPDQDPHLFETSPSVLREIAKARIVVFNGADYDSWMPKLLAVAPRTGRTVLAVADLMGRKPGDNPHLWYDPDTAPAAAKTLSRALIAADPAHEPEYAERLQRFLGSLSPLREKIAAIAAKYGGAEVTATEPVFGYMAAALKLHMRNERFQLAVMNDSEPSARDVAAFEQDLTQHKVRLMLYNKQAASKIVRHLVDVARGSKIPVVGITETQPAGLSFQDWMMAQLDEVERALSGPSS